MAPLRIHEEGGLLASEIHLEISDGDNGVRDEVRKMVEDQGQKITDIGIRLTQHLGGPVLPGHTPDIGEFGRFARETREHNKEQTVLLQKLLEGQVDAASEAIGRDQVRATEAEGRDQVRVAAEQATRGAIEGLRRDVDLLKVGQITMIQRVSLSVQKLEPAVDFVVGRWGKLAGAVLSSSLLWLYAKQAWRSTVQAAARIHFPH
jgi:hypothetical protein